MPTTTIKALEGDRVGGYLVVWGSPQQRDLQKEYFTPDTYLGLEWDMPRPMFYHHGLDGMLKSDLIGIIDVLKADSVGVWAEAQLHTHNRYIQAVRELIRKGVLAWSSGSLPQMVEVAPDGRIKRWPIVEGSSTPTPAEPRRTNIDFLKTAIKGVPGFKSLEGLIDKAGLNQQAQDSAKPNQTTTQGVKSMDVAQIVRMTLQTLGAELPEDQVNALVTQIQQQVGMTDATASANPEDQMKNAAAAVAKAEQIANLVIKMYQEGQQAQAQSAIDRAVQGAKGQGGQSRASGADVTNRPAQPQPTHIQVTDLRYDHLEPADLVFGANVLLASGKRVSEEFLRAAASKALREGERSEGSVYANGHVRESFTKSVGTFKADEIMATSLATAGQEWVSVAYEEKLVERVRNTPIYQDLIRLGVMQVNVPKGANSVIIPVEGAGSTWYSLAGSGELDDLGTDERLPVQAKNSRPVTGRRQLDLGVVMARTSYTDILDEDSLIPMLNYLRTTLERDAEEQIEGIILNGDKRTAANTNINLIDGTPSVDAKGRGPAYLASYGFLYYGLTVAGMSRDAGAELDEDDYLNTYALLPKELRQDKKKLLYLIDSDVELATMRIPSVKTRDVNSAATIENGELTKMWGVGIRMSAFLEKANATGRISATGSNNTTGRIQVIRPDRYAIAFKRQVVTETQRDITAAATDIVSSLRFGMIAASVQPGVGVSYNVKI